MISDIMMKVLLIQYIILAVICIFEKDYNKAFYWASVVLLTTSILIGMK